MEESLKVGAPRGWRRSGVAAPRDHSRRVDSLSVLFVSMQSSLPSSAELGHRLFSLPGSPRLSGASRVVGDPAEVGRGTGWPRRPVAAATLQRQPGMKHLCPSRRRAPFFRFPCRPTVTSFVDQSWRHTSVWKPRDPARTSSFGGPRDGNLEGPEEPCAQRSKSMPGSSFTEKTLAIMQGTTVRSESPPQKSSLRIRNVALKPWLHLSS